MNRGPDFDDLVGAEVVGAERERLQRTHELLVTAGPPPELSPELAAGPTLAMTLSRRPGRVRRRLVLVAAAAVAVALVFVGGYVAGSGSHSSGVSPVRALELRGTAAAPNALASLRLLPADAGNWPMTLSVTGLPATPARGYYEVYVVRGGKPWASCGTFVVSNPETATTVTLNAPYRLRPSDSWVVTRHAAGSGAPGPTVLQQAA